MTSSNGIVRLGALAAILATLLVVAAPVGAPTTIEGAPLQGACAWEAIANSAVNVFHAATAYDPDHEKMYIYGGFDLDYAVSAKLELVDLSGATAGDARQSPVAVGGALGRFGAAGAFRSGKAEQSAAYFIGGLDDPDATQARGDVQVYMPGSRAWSRPKIDNAAEFQGRAFASAAYDPAHDVIWVVGGIATCQFSTMFEGAACAVRSLATGYFSFDAVSGQPTWKILPGAAQGFYGAAMVYDRAGQRMIIYGGTATGTVGSDLLLQLDLSNPDPARAIIKRLTATGSPPALYFHAGAYDSAYRRAVFYGGVLRNYLRNNEATNEFTWALDLTGAAARWSRLEPAGSPKARVGAVMGYSARHSAVIVALGRDKTKQVFTGGGGPEPIESETVQRATFAMTCTGPTATALPTTPAPGSPTPTTPSPPTDTPTIIRPTQTQAPDLTATALASTPTATLTSTTRPPSDVFLPVAYRRDTIVPSRNAAP